MAELHGMKRDTTGSQAIADMIRKKSEAGQLITKSEILCRAVDPNLSPSPATDPAEEVGNVLKKLIDENEDLHELAAADGSQRYYSSRFMTAAYARILLQKQGDPRQLIAEIVRQNSAFYPRPVPCDVFERPPFGLTPQEVLNFLEQMAAAAEYHDIQKTVTSASTVFLYSTHHLDPDHAAMLAEWLDVGQSNNP